MRKGIINNEQTENSEYKIIAVDDEQGIVDSLSIFFKKDRIPFQRSYRSSRSGRTCKKRTL